LLTIMSLPIDRGAAGITSPCGADRSGLNNRMANLLHLRKSGLTPVYTGVRPLFPATMSLLIARGAPGIALPCGADRVGDKQSRGQRPAFAQKWSDPGVQAKK
jgi:hypothetical protein